MRYGFDNLKVPDLDAATIGELRALRDAFQRLATAAEIATRRRQSRDDSDIDAYGSILITLRDELPEWAQW